MIDVKELRIGNHISVKGERCRVESLQGYGALMGYFTPQGDWGAADPMYDWIEPIPITAELLTELGFEHGSDEREWHKYIGEAWIGIHLFLDKERMRITVCDDSAEYGNVIIRYLHEAENFVYMALHKELIEE